MKGICISLGPEKLIVSGRPSRLRLLPWLAGHMQVVTRCQPRTQSEDAEDSEQIDLLEAVQQGNWEAGGGEKGLLLPACCSHQHRLGNAALSGHPEYYVGHKTEEADLALAGIRECVLQFCALSTSLASP